MLSPSYIKNLSLTNDAALSCRYQLHKMNILKDHSIIEEFYHSSSAVTKNHTSPQLSPLILRGIPHFWFIINDCCCCCCCWSSLYKVWTDDNSFNWFDKLIIIWERLKAILDPSSKPCSQLSVHVFILPSLIPSNHPAYS